MEKNFTFLRLVRPAEKDKLALTAPPTEQTVIYLLLIVLDQFCLFCFVCLCVEVQTQMDYSLFLVDWRLIAVKIHWSRISIWLETFVLWPTCFLCVCSMQTHTMCIFFPIQHPAGCLHKLGKKLKKRHTRNKKWSNYKLYNFHSSSVFSCEASEDGATTTFNLCNSLKTMSNTTVRTDLFSHELIENTLGVEDTVIPNTTLWFGFRNWS